MHLDAFHSWNSGRAFSLFVKKFATKHLFVNPNQDKNMLYRQKIFPLLAILLSFFVFTLAFNFDCEAASSKKSTRISSKKSSKTHARAKKEHKASKRKAEVATADSDKKIWLDRAAKSEIFTGKASWYGRDFHNKATASGVAYDMYTFTAAHRTLPMGTVVKVTDQDNGKSVMVCVTDRGPYVNGRIIDLSYAAAQKLDLGDRGVGRVKLEVVSDEKGLPLKANKAYFVEYLSDSGKKSIGPFKAFFDAAAMHEAVRQAHPDANVVLDSAAR